MKRIIPNDLIKTLNAIEVMGITTIILMAFFFQFVMGEIPCPLCLLQRLGLLAIGFGFLLNMHYHVRPSHYALSLLASVFTAFVSLRQIALHVSDPVGFGSKILGMHMYSWVFVISMVAIIYIAIVLSYPQQYEIRKPPQEISEAKNKKIKAFTHIAFILFAIIIFANIASTFFQCGLHECPDNPVGYVLV
ncbi:disulfide bond formation protein B [Allofrancisella guangzhouensis]|uniref:Disulfide bond formation protein DsbB n=1 Tax=Allofrancisella guangzhouensis TaxID=594679 RepID=A0A0A8E4A0_9GAMM|nr:disulfide bond formation protein B [Allofrancisella guangzhouensis]AJC48838.1 disulfide bond formation protein DsbB [Allofrancisella guangzhouensis]MBK2027262.1 disulfide bond formation protein B [Allofrancisella guangzhouensis]MBK2044716.1 disulfide bond formation protein B [Allofrancisella guangzhouensis]MBK2045942.1 disulfide bond formation protein B [Allofrancisella guangzhouensis]